MLFIHFDVVKMWECSKYLCHTEEVVLSYEAASLAICSQSLDQTELVMC